MTSKQRRTAYTLVGAVTLTMGLGGAVSACTSSPSSAHPAIFSPGADPSGSAPGSSGGASVSPAASPSGAAPSASASPKASPTGSPAGSPTATVTAAPSSAPAGSGAPSYPAAAPQTGGGGTSGLQDSLLFTVGGLAVVAGGGSLALRRKFRAMSRRDS